MKKLVVFDLDGTSSLLLAAGLMVLSREQPSVIHCRLAEPVLTPVLPEERHGAIANVVFPARY